MDPIVVLLAILVLGLLLAVWSLERQVRAMRAERLEHESRTRPRVWDDRPEHPTHRISTRAMTAHFPRADEHAKTSLYRVK